MPTAQRLPIGGQKEWVRRRQRTAKKTLGSVLCVIIFSLRHAASLSKVRLTTPMLVEACNGQVDKTFVPLKAWESAQVLSGLHAGDAVLLRGRLRWKPVDKALAVLAWSLQPLHGSVSAGRN